MNDNLPPLFYNDRSRRGRLRLVGRDRQSFLQGMVTNDVAALTPGTGCYAFLLDPTGHVLADVRVICGDGFLLLDTEPDMAAFVAETLERYLIMEKCRIADITDEWAQIFVGGSAVPDFLLEYFRIPDALDWNEGRNAEIIESDENVGLVAATRLIPGVGCDLYVSVALKDSIIAKLDEAGGKSISDEEMESLRIDAGIPRFGADIDPKVLAPETAQQSRAIAYRKGCYIGQEIVARIDARGHANRTLAGFLLTDAPLPAPGATIEVDGREVGRITSATRSILSDRSIALGYIRNEFAAPGTTISVAGATGVVSELPFFVKNEIVEEASV